MTELFTGQPVERREDKRLLLGRGRYVDDIVMPDQIYAAFYRSPHAHARIKAIDTSAARRLPGMLP